MVDKCGIFFAFSSLLCLQKLLASYSRQAILPMISYLPPFSTESPVMPIENISRVDVHTHVVPPFWRQYCEETGYAQADGIQEIPVQSIHALEDRSQADLSVGMGCGSPFGRDA